MSAEVASPLTAELLAVKQPSPAIIIKDVEQNEEDHESFVDEVLNEEHSDHSGSDCTYSDVESDEEDVEVDDEEGASVDVSLNDDSDAESTTKEAEKAEAANPLAEKLAAKREERAAKQHSRNYGRSKISTGTKQYMAKYPEHSSDGILRLGNIVPDFSTDTSQGPMESFHQWTKGKWTVLFSHPSDFTPVCTTEIAAIAAFYPELKKLDCLLIGLSVDSAESHLEWIQDIVAHYHVDDDVENCNLDLSFPIIADVDRKVANLFGMIDVTNPENLTIRSVFIMDPEHRLRISLSYPASVGRSLDEIVRCVKSLQLSYQKSIATPANWPRNHARVKMPDGTISRDWQGSVFLLPSVSTEQALLNYPHFHTCAVPSQKKYLRLVQPAHVGVDPADILSVGLFVVDHRTETTQQSGSTAGSTVPEVVESPTEETWQWKWPWEAADNNKDDGNKEKSTTEASQWPWENWKWPWEQEEVKENKN